MDVNSLQKPTRLDDLMKINGVAQLAVIIDTANAREKKSVGCMISHII